MRVAFVSVDTPHSHDTARTRRIERVARHVNDHEDHEAVVCCTRWWDGDADWFEQDELEYQGVTAERSPRRFGAGLPLALRRLRPDVIHASYWPTAGAVGAIAGGRIARAPVVLDWYGDRPVEPESRWTRASVRRPHRLIAPSRHVETTVRELGADGERTVVIPESIDIDLVRSISATDGPDIVTARQFDEDANIEMMLLGFAELRDRGFTAMIIGDGPRREEYEKQAAELRIDDRVSFPGWLPLEERIAHYKGAHVFVQTAERCQFATELLWALACGCAGIVDYQEDSAGHELVEKLDRGFRTTSSEALSEAIVEAGEHEHTEYNDAYARYDRPVVLQQYFDTYRELLER